MYQCGVKRSLNNLPYRSFVGIRNKRSNTYKRSSTAEHFSESKEHEHSSEEGSFSSSLDESSSCSFRSLSGGARLIACLRTMTTTPPWTGSWLMERGDSFLVHDSANHSCSKMEPHENHYLSKCDDDVSDANQFMSEPGSLNSQFKSKKSILYPCINIQLHTSHKMFV